MLIWSFEKSVRLSRVRTRREINSLIGVDTGLALDSDLKMSRWDNIAEVMDPYVDMTRMHVNEATARAARTSLASSSEDGGQPSSRPDAAEKAHASSPSATHASMTDPPFAAVDDIADVFLSILEVVSPDLSDIQEQDVRSHLRGVICRSGIVTPDGRTRSPDLVWMMEECAGEATAGLWHTDNRSDDVPTS